MLGQKSHQGVKLVKTGRSPELKGENCAEKPCAPRAFPPTFGALPGIQIQLTIAHWKGLDVYFPTQVEFSNLVSIFPYKSAFSKDCFLCVQKGAVRSFFAFFLTF